MRRGLLLYLLSALLSAGCITERQGGVETQAEEAAFALRIGRTTARDVVAHWGNPDFVLGETWVWWNVRSVGGKLRAAYWGLGLTTANLRRGLSEYRLTFAPDGKLAKVESTETLPGGPRWSLLPD